MVKKKYSLKRMYSMVISFKLPSGIKTITFSGGSRHHGRNGYYVTSDEELQKAIESSAYFGNEIILAEETKIEEKKEEAKEVIPTDYKSLLKDAENVIEEPSVTTIQKAKMWLQANYGKSFKGTTKDDIKREAASVYNVLFPNWL